MKQNRPGLRSVDIFNGEYAIEPYLVFTEFYMDRPIFGPHPHAGISVLTYILPDSKGSFINRDSRGDHSRIEPGGGHVTQAGAGIQHDEVPEKIGTECHGMQIWINHAAADRLVAPRALHADPGQIPTVTDGPATIRVVLGEHAGVSSPIPLVTKAQLLDVTLGSEGSVTLSAGTMCFVYVLTGQLLIEGQEVGAPSLVVYSTTGDAIQLNAATSGCNVLFGSGEPHNEPIVHGGPFVGTTVGEIAEMRRRFSQGEMGELLPQNP